MTAEIVLASGRDSDLLDLGGGRVLRRPRVPRPLDGEAAVMRRVRAAGYPVPEVYEVRPDGMVMARVEGPTMLRDLTAHPWRVLRHARTLAALHHRLHAIGADAGDRPTFGRSGPDDVLVHGDLHPDNVLLSPGGPVVIDWANAGRGPAGADVADCWLLLASADAPVGPVMRLLVAVLRRRFLASFLRHAGRAESAGKLGTALARRLVDTNLSAEERARMRRVVARHGRD